jgi:hypothetical protein
MFIPFAYLKSAIINTLTYNGQQGIECATILVNNPNLYPPSSGMTMSPDGTKVFAVLHNGNNEGFVRDSVIQFNLSTPWDLTTMSTQAGGTPSINSFPSYNENTPYDAYFSPDGLNLYVHGIQFNRIYRYTLGTAYTPSTATAHSSFATGLTGVGGLSFSQDGTYMFVVGSGPVVTRYLLSTAWDVTTAATNGSTKAITGGASLYFTPDGLNLYSFGGASTIFRYNLATAWDLGSTTITTNSGNISTIVGVGGGNSNGIHLSSDGTRFFFSNYVGAGNSVKAVDFSIPFNVTGAI